MTVFYVCAAFLIALALLWILRPLGRRAPTDDLQREAVNLAILKDQLAELETDRNAGILSDGQYTSSRVELERRVLDEAQPAAHVARRGVKWTAPFLALFIAVGSIGLYMLMGSPDSLREPTQFSAHEIDDMIAGLAQRMKEHPDDAKGWGILARSYYALGRFDEAADAYAQLSGIVPPQADLLADYADALGMAQRDFSGKPTELAQQALKLEATHWKALTILGGAAFARKDYAQAVHYWERLLATLPPESELAMQVREGVEEARLQIGGAKTEKVPATALTRSITGTVKLSPQLAAQAAPDDTLFIFARPAQGAKMPVAVLRLKAKQLPATFELNDSHAMRSDAKLSAYPAVVVGARISKSGNPLPQPGDLEGYSAEVKPGAQALQILIDRRVP